MIVSLAVLFFLLVTRSYKLIYIGSILIVLYTMSYDTELTPAIIPLDIGFYSCNLLIEDLVIWFIVLTFLCCSWIVTSSVLKHSTTKYLDLLVCYIIICSILFFTSGDLITMYLSFELITIPILVYVGLLGVSVRRTYALSVMIIYMILSSGLMAVVLFSYVDTFLDSQSFYLVTQSSASTDTWTITILLCVFFGVKIPVYPFYVWLPEAHVESNTEMSILLASIVLKFGVFGLLRIGYYFDSMYIYSVSSLLLAVCLVGLVHSSISSIQHLDLKKLVAYSSIVHMQFGMIGLFSNDSFGLWLMILGLLIHGIVSIGLFYMLGIASESVGTRHIAFIHSGTSLTPILSLLGFVTVLLNISSPLSLGSIVEFLTLFFYSQFGTFILAIGSLCAIWFCTLFSLILLYRAFMVDSSWYHIDTNDLTVLDSMMMFLMYLVLVFTIIMI